MKFREFGNKAHPTMVLLHSEALSWWSLEPIIGSLKTDYSIVAPVIDGHGEDCSEPFADIRDSARKLIAYIDANCGGKVFAISGLCLGAQIAVEVLSERPRIARYAVLESALVYPAGKAAWFLFAAGCGLFFRPVRNRRLAKRRAKRLGVPETMFGRYYEDCSKISKESRIHVRKSIRSYTVPDGAKRIQAEVLIIAGTKELRLLDRSVRGLMRILPHARVCVAPGTRHGGFTLTHPGEYLALTKDLMEERLPHSPVSSHGFPGRR